MPFWTEMTKRSLLQKTIFVTAFFVIGMICDMLLSLNAYIQNPVFFIQYENNREIVSFFTSHTFPFWDFLMWCFVPIFALWAFAPVKSFTEKLDGRKERRKRKWLYAYQSAIFEISIAVFLTMVCGGLTWYFGFVPMFLVSLLIGITVGYTFSLTYFLVRLQISSWRQEHH